MGNNIARDAHCNVIMGNDVAMDIYCDVTMSNDVAMYISQFIKFTFLWTSFLMYFYAYL